MTVLEKVAKELHMKPNELMKDSLKTYLEHRLNKIESEIFLIAKRYGVKDVFELDSKAKNGIVSESEAFEDYFKLDNLEDEREKIKKFLDKL